VGTRGAVDLARTFEQSGVKEVLDQLDRELVGLKPVKTRRREIASGMRSRTISATG
jgi:hypothetical protein